MTAALSKMTVDNPSAGAPSAWQTGMTVNGQPDGTVTLSHSDGAVLSVQPDGSWQTRPKGTAGAWEKATVSGSLITYAPAGVPFAYLFLSAVPNS